MNDVLQKGMWLGLENRIKRMDLLKSGWKATDSTGAVYYQHYMKDGLLAAWEPTPGNDIKVRIPWPPRTA